MPCTAPATTQPLVIHPLARPLHFKHPGPFVRGSQGELFAPAEDWKSIDRSVDMGVTWTRQPVFQYKGWAKEYKTCNSTAMFRTQAGTLLFSFFNVNEMHFTWRDELRDLSPGNRGPHYVTRSTDDGKTWSTPTLLHQDWTGDIRNIIQLASGRILISSMKMLASPTHNTVLTYYSDDDGLTWTASNLIDLGGQGHHSGVLEATIEALNDGSVLMLLRTNWGQFWRALSFDQGQTWSDIQPSGIDASSAPGLLKRLHSGRLLLVWNRAKPIGWEECEMKGGDHIWSEIKASNHREQISLAWYDESKHTICKPVVIASKKGSHLAYPRIFEPTPGTLWLTIMWVSPGNEQLSLVLQEKDFI